MTGRTRLVCTYSLALCALTALAPSPSKAFGPSRSFPAGETEPGRPGLGSAAGTPHSMITEDALEEVLAREYGITDLMPFHEQAIRGIVQANTRVDDNQTFAQLHCDGETFFAAHIRLDQLRKRVIDALAKEDYETARSRLGEALHTLQDFYSHSNWVELGNTTAHPKFGAATAKLEMTYEEVAGPTVATCTVGNCYEIGPCNNLITGKLTSGYYAGDVEESDAPVSQAISGKCHHGGYSDKAAPPHAVLGSEGINKDTLISELSPHANYHPEAVEAARDASIKYVLSIKQQAKNFLLMFSGMGSFGLVLDLSTSMGDVIKTLSEQAADGIHRQRSGSGVDSKLIFVGFSDPKIAPTYAGTDYDDWRETLESASEMLSDGGDCPEVSLDATLRALWSCNDRSVLYLITDAGAKNTELAARIIEVATKRHVRIYPVVLAAAPGTTCSAPDTSVYSELARQTGGRVLNLARSEVAALSRKLRNLSAPAGLLVIDNSGSSRTLPAAAAKSTGNDFPFVIDGATSSASVLVRGGSDLQLLRPNGSAVVEGEPGVIKSVIGDQLMYELEKPDVGTWTISSSTAVDSVSVTGESQLDLLGIDFVEARGRAGHQGYFPLHGRPIAGKRTLIAVDTSAPVQDARIELRAGDGSVLATAPVSPRPGADGQPLNDGQYGGAITVPSAPFMVYLVGKTQAGQPFVRSTLVEIVPQYVSITAPTQKLLRPGGTAVYEFSLHNEGQRDTFSLAMGDTGGFVVRGTQRITIEAGATVPVRISALAAANAPVGATSTISLDVASTTDSTRTTSASVDAEVSQDLDRDHDGLLDDMDNCPALANVDQLDWDGDGIGNACDTSPGTAPPETGCTVAPSESAPRATWWVLVLAMPALVWWRRRRAR